jgi:hypothetical protein
LGIFDESLNLLECNDYFCDDNHPFDYFPSSIIRELEAGKNYFIAIEAFGGTDCAGFQWVFRWSASDDTLQFFHP